MTFAPYFQVGAAMGYSPTEIRDMSLWEFEAAFEGWSKANGISTGLSDTEFDELSAMVDAAQAGG